MEPKPLDPAVGKLWRVVSALAAIPFVVGILAVGALLDAPGLLVVALLGAVVAPAVVVPPIAYRRWRYAIRERDLFTSRGAIRHVETLVPFDRIQFVETRQGPLDRVFEVTQVVVYTAAGRAGRIPGLDRSTAESIREELSKVAGTTSV